MLPLLIALQFLTRLPLRLSQPPTPQQQGCSLLWYPLVGALLGALLWWLAVILDDAPTLLAAALLLASWVILTGALHLDGLADCADAWVGGHGDRSRSLAIMKDPASGPVAVVVLVIVLLLKFGALQALLSADQLQALLLAPLFARSVVPALFMTTPYVRPQGLGAAMAAHLPRAAALAILAIVVALVVLAVPAAWLPLLVATLTLMLVRGLAVQRLGGFTGDVAGALIELVETAVLVVLALTSAVR